MVFSFENRRKPIILAIYLVNLLQALEEKLHMKSAEFGGSIISEYLLSFYYALQN
jgi:hypothetical protein